MLIPEFWAGKRVLVTGHTGFKGGWLALWLATLGARVTGYSLAPPSSPNLFETLKLDEIVAHVIGDVRDYEKLFNTVKAAQPEIVFHLAAQSLVRHSYDYPVDTYSVNVVGTASLLESLRRIGCARAIVIVTSDKCYEARNAETGYRETDRMGGHDPYSSSKGCAELVTAAFRSSFFSSDRSNVHRAAVASARAGNVIGGGDWAQDRIIPDAIRAFSHGRPLQVRYPDAIRPWQHVLEPLSGYLLLARRLWSDGALVAEGWNFGPSADDEWPVRGVVETMVRLWGADAEWEHCSGEHMHEASLLKLNCAKAKMRLGWRPRWPLDRALAVTVDWYKSFYNGGNMRAVSLQQIEEYGHE